MEKVFCNEEVTDFIGKIQKFSSLYYGTEPSTKFIFNLMKTGEISLADSSRHTAEKIASGYYQ